ncbi:MAG: hypothetical protein HDR09_14490 [Lachnospiraceae bacterium]|nr:hypothetical protein [Lachnospiraceae bacterium]
MKNNKKYIFILLGICLTILIGGAIFFLKRNPAADKNAVSRYEWLEMLGERFGVNEYINETPYFRDVDSGNPYFAYIQSAVEGKVLDVSSDFDGERYASGEFIIVTAMKALGESKVQIYLNVDDDITDETYAELAIEHGLVEKEKLKNGFTKEECEQVLETLYNLHFGEFWKDDYSDVVYRDGVIELSSKDISSSNIEGSEIAVTDDMINSCKVGTIIVFIQENTGLKLARKIVGIDADGTLILDTVELNEVVETLTVSDITEITFDDIVNYYSLDENISGSNNLMVQPHDTSFIDARVFSGEVNSKGYKLSVSTQGEDEKRCIAIQITDNVTGITYALPINDKVKREEEYAAEINIDKIYVGGQVDYSLLGGLKYAEAAVDAHATFKSEIKAEKEKKIPLFQIPVPLGNGLIGADIQIYLVLSLDGSISFEAELPIEASVSYEKNRGLRNFDHHISVEDPKIEVDCNAGVGLRIEPVLMVLGCPNVMDMELDIGVSAEAKVTAQPNSQICADISISFPVLTISVCDDDDIDTIIGDLGISAEWEIITSDNAPIKKGLHYELGPGIRAEFVKECTYKKQEEHSPETAQQDDSLPSETSRFTEFSDYEGPIELCISAPFEDAGEYYIIKGSLQISYSIFQRDFNKLHPGERFTILDKEFILGDRLETEEFPAEIYSVYCVNDDNTYYIQTKVALDHGSRNGESYYPICRSIPDYEGIYESMLILSSDLDVHEIKIAKDTYITSLIEMSHYTDHLIAVDVSGKSEEEILALQEENRQNALAQIAHTAEECFEDHVLIDDWLDIANFSSVYGELDFPIYCYTAFDENGEIDIIVWNSFG